MCQADNYGETNGQTNMKKLICGLRILFRNTPKMLLPILRSLLNFPLRQGR